ncbi:MAG: hypothetical protein WEC84_02025 [Candidatus Andersenbacteria bacterium]
MASEADIKAYDEAQRRENERVEAETVAAWKWFEEELEKQKEAANEAQEQALQEVGCKECGAPPSALCYGYCPDCEHDELEAYAADAMETEADFQASRQ